MTRWLPIPGFGGRYTISDDGHVWSVERNEPLKAQYDKDGYARVNLVPPGRKQVGRRISRLMLEAFVGPAPPSAPLACHGDGDLTNNTLANLRWGSHSDNAKDRVRHGRHPVGEKASRHKLTEAQVLAIRTAPRGEASALARSFGLTKGAAQCIRVGKNWGHVPGAVPGPVKCIGEDHPNAKLTADTVAAIRADRRFQKQIAADYGIHQVTVSKIKRGVLWADAA